MRGEGGRIEGRKGGGRREGGEGGRGDGVGRERRRGEGREGREGAFCVGETVAIGIMFLNGAKKDVTASQCAAHPCCVSVSCSTLSLASPPGGCTQLVLNLDVPRFGRNGLQTCYG